MINAYDPVLVAWKILEISSLKGRQITHMQLQKLLYIAHGYCLAALNRPLITEKITAWKFGPVIPSVYHTFKGYGGYPITAAHPAMCSAIFPQDVMNVLTSVVDSYGSFDGGQLSELTHRQGSPWYRTWTELSGSNRDNAIIPDEVIQNHYRGILSGVHRSSL